MSEGAACSRCKSVNTAKGRTSSYSDFMLPTGGWLPPYERFAMAALACLDCGHVGFEIKERERFAQSVAAARRAGV